MTSGRGGLDQPFTKMVPIELPLLIANKLIDLIFNKLRALDDLLNGKSFRLINNSLTTPKALNNLA